jgi:septal ring factor EnvC (AmiA/AmiB activator)
MEYMKQIKETQQQLREVRSQLYRHQGDREWLKGEVAELEKNLDWLGRQLRLSEKRNAALNQVIKQTQEDTSFTARPPAMWRRRRSVTEQCRHKEWHKVGNRQHP